MSMPAVSSTNSRAAMYSGDSLLCMGLPPKHAHISEPLAHLALYRSLPNQKNKRPHSGSTQNGRMAAPITLECSQYTMMIIYS